MGIIKQDVLAVLYVEDLGLVLTLVHRIIQRHIVMDRVSARFVVVMAIWKTVMILCITYVVQVVMEMVDAKHV